VGYDALEPALLAALATREPLLLVSDHGAAKTLLLVRLAEALGLAFRHYNASLLQFDDLAGFPIPDEQGGIRYAAGPGAIWDAQAVFFDEIGRCRPVMANKLFPLVHERRIQGVRLERLEHRWAATNPPAEAHDGAGDDTYDGVERLDPALADRFAYVVRLPRFGDLSDADRALVIRGAGDEVAPHAHAGLRELVHATRDLIPPTGTDLGDVAVQYVLALSPHLEAAGITLGGRRAATLHRNLVAVSAASAALGRPLGEPAFFAALQASIPDVVRRIVPDTALAAAHGAAWEQVTLPPADPVRVFRAVLDPHRRALLAVTLPGLDAPFRGEALVSALAALPGWQREILAWHLLPRLVRDPIVPAPAVESVAEIVEQNADGGSEIRGFRGQLDWVPKVRSALAKSALEQHAADYVLNALVRAHRPYAASAGLDLRDWERHLDAALAFWRQTAESLGGALAEAA
jgi:MoxR-like ATPase